MKSGRLFRVLNTPNRVTAAVSMATFGIGLGVGYLLGKQNCRLELEFHEIPDKVDPDLTGEDFTKARSEAKTKRGTVVIPAMEKPEKITIEQIHDDDVKDYITVDGKVTPVVVEEVKDALKKPPDDETLVKSVFGESGPDWDYEFEKTQRTSEAPYIIHVDEFGANELDYTQTTLTYYAGDDVMVDDHDAPLYDYQSLTGPLKFGHGSKDPNIVYVRNMRNRAEYEVLFDEGLYSVEVLGEDIPNNERVKHVQHSKVRRFRSEE